MAKEVRLAKIPEGEPGPEHFEVVGVPVGEPGPGEVVVRNRYFQVSARLRTLLAGDIEGTPLPPVRVGEVPPSITVGEVVAVGAGSESRVGELVSHWAGWREYAVLPAAARTVLDDRLPDPVAHLGSGWTAYAALTRHARLRHGETVLVTAGGGGVGSLVGPLARVLGAGRVVATARTRAKAARVVEELGYDAAYVVGAEELEEVDVVVDNVGGADLRAALAVARPGARVALVGALSGQAGAAPVEVDTFGLILRGISLHGVNTRPDPHERDEWLTRFGGWLRSGELTFPHVRVEGIDAAPRALQEVIEGRHVGTVAVYL
ncbi:2-alkenal reductase [Actinokineospora baliensis]|uniref:zinc-binding dehydrogenase n=1 Tax=Actinokineospora baliensis TaxID=547056 RepID=UPI00195DFE3A|nr:zinc-binding dehydrogenase [Actinokineospora baliensis]MBM7774213.1 2-alkenal reductase [Actinokineospora baliensis]